MSALPVPVSAVVPSASVNGASPCILTVPQFDLVVPAEAHALAGFRAWAVSEEFPQRGRICFLNGEIFIDMSPEELETHSGVKLEVTRVLATLNRKEKLGRVYPDGVLLTNPTAGLSTEADAAFATWKDLESGRLRQVPREGVAGQYVEVEGTPSWVLEVVSAYSVRKDTRVLPELYHRAGVDEVWIIDARGADIQFRLLVRGEEEYEEATGRGGWRPSTVFGRRFRLTRERGRMGLWEYTLEVRR
jgi:Uma2 family endonuclease